MANYVKSTDFQAKDALLTGNPAKIIKGTEINDEFNAIQTAVATKANLASPAFIGNPTAATQASGNSSTRLATTAFVDGEITTAFATLGTIATQDANNVSITGGAISGLSSLAIPSAATAVTQSVGDSSTKVATTAFVNAEITNDIGNSFTGSNQLLSGNGYQKLPGGLIIQWFTTPSESSSQGAFTYDYPIPFPTAFLAASVSTTNSGSSSNSDLYFQFISSTTSTISVYRQAVNNFAPIGAMIIALGY
jgi:hypothetical protein